MHVIKRNLKELQDRKKSYVDQHIAFKEFQVESMCNYASSPRESP